MIDAKSIEQVTCNETSPKTSPIDSFYRSILDIIKETWIFFQIELKNVASFGIIAILFSMVIPFGIILMISMMPIEISREVAVIYISGNLVASISNMCVVALAQVLIGMRMQHGFEHLATLPIFAGSPILGTFLGFFVTTVPSLIVMPWLGSLLFNAAIEVSGWLILVILLTMVTMIGIGGVLGTFSENYRKANTITMIAMFFVMFATPLYYPMESLPFVIQVFQRFLPFSYSLEAMRTLMINPVISSVVIRDIIVLVIWMVIALCLASRFVTWKQR